MPTALLGQRPAALRSRERRMVRVPSAASTGDVAARRRWPFRDLTPTLRNMNSEQLDGLQAYADALHAYARCPDSRPAYYSPTEKKTVATRADSDGTLLPATRRPVRGGAGVRVNVEDVPRAVVGRDSMEALLSQAIPLSASRPGTSAEVACAPERRSLHEAFKRLRQALFVHGELAVRLQDGVGYKTFELAQLPQRVLYEASADRPMTAVFTLGQLFENEVAKLGQGATPAADFDDWHAVVEGIISTLVDLEGREEHRYNAFAYLNGPLFDCPASRILLGTEASRTGSVLIAQATDTDLTKMIEGFGYAAALPAGLNECNTLLTIPLTGPVLGTVVEFESCYPSAASTAARALDVLRVVFGEDIGICALLIEPAQFGAPELRKSYHTKFNPSVGAFLPQRVAFPAVPERTISESELDEASALLARHIGETDVKGFGVGLRRFRDAWDRHWPDSPERLLDIAIALEALFLNDGDDKELRHRLALRVARFLEAPGPRRIHTFNAVRQLYDLRSKVAHGATLQNLTGAAAERLAATMTEAPTILRTAIRRMIEGAGPVGLDGEALRNYWSRLELS